MYALADLDTILILSALFAMATVADQSDRRTAVAMLITASVVVTMFFLHGGKVRILTGTPLRLPGIIWATSVGGLYGCHQPDELSGQPEPP